MTDYREFAFDMEDLSRHDFGGLPIPLGTPDDKILLGICAMKKKANSTPMNEILGRLDSNCFEIVRFDQDVIISKPVEEWPRCHCLIAFFSDGFPLAKAEAYAKLYRPFLINELKPQHLLKDRRHMLLLMERCGVPTPEHVVMNRSSWSPSGFPVQVNAAADMVEGDDYIIVNGQRMDKPFVEKPVNGENHNIYIYYPRSAGGGSCRLFRKVKNRSSEFFPEENNVRRDGSYIYERFLRTEGSDVKVYTVTSNYAHSEARKSPAIDGVVSRNEDGFEVRYPILLNNMEKEIASRIVQATGQRICGFDVLRSDSMSFVCDVNGWSFVKNNHKYYDDVSLILSDLMRRAVGLSTPKPGIGNKDSFDDDTDDTDVETDSGIGSEEHEELRCVIAVIRHGDRTPKQKLKMMVSDSKLLELFNTYGGSHGSEPGREELKLKSARELGDVLKIVCCLLEAIVKKHGTKAEDSDCDDRDELDALLQARSVLEMHGTFKGINRKVQLKPTKWDSDTGRVIEAQFILKWGGVLTGSGREQAEIMGQSFRQKLYPFDGLLRLHSTYRHDLKIYSSNEGRVQVTAAAFAKGMLQLEGHLTPILTSLVRKSPEVDTLLDDATDAKVPIEKVKKRLHEALLSPSPSKEALLSTVAATDAASVTGALSDLNFDPKASMRKLHLHISGLVKQLRVVVQSQKARFGLSKAAAKTGVVNTGKLLGESEGGSAAASLDRVHSDRNLQSIVSEDNCSALLMSLYRWTKLEKDFYQKKKDKYDLSKVPDISDSVKFDLLHNPRLIKLKPANLRAIFDISSLLADVVVPQEYGISHDEKRDIGSRISKSLVWKIQNDLVNTVAYCTKVSKRGVLKKDQSTNTLFETGSTGATTGSSAGEGAGTMIETDDRSVDEDSVETFHRLDKRHARSLGIKSRDRMVRTRLYFTSESHLHSLLNVLRFSLSQEHRVSPDDIELPTLSDETIRRLSEMTELNYLTHIVFRLFEIIPSKRRKDVKEETVGGGYPKRFRISVAISPGVGVTIDELDNVKQGERRKRGKPKPDYGSSAEIQLLPCSPLIPIWTDLEYNLVDNLFKTVATYVQQRKLTNDVSLTSPPPPPATTK